MLTRRDLFRLSGRAALAVTVAPVLARQAVEVWDAGAEHVISVPSVSADIWSPADIAGVQHWLRCEDGKSVWSWYDRDGNEIERKEFC